VSLVYEYAGLLERGGRVGDAERALRDLLAKDPLDANALNSLGYLLADHGQRLDEAVDLVQRALKIEPANPAFLDSLGWAYFQQGKLDLADAPLTQAADRMPSSSTINEHLGDLRVRQERFADAVAAFERSLAGDGDSIDRAKVEKKVRDARARPAINVASGPRPHAETCPPPPPSRGRDRDSMRRTSTRGAAFRRRHALS
jgi:Flp pilus assembly protein TadD